MRERCTGESAGVWEPLAYLRQLRKTIGFSQSPPRGGGAPLQNGEFKRAVESHTATSMKLGGLLAFGSTLMEPFLAAANPAVTLPAYVAMSEVQRRPYDCCMQTRLLQLS